MSLVVTNSAIPSNGMNYEESITDFNTKFKERNSYTNLARFYLQNIYNDKVYKKLDNIFNVYDRLTWNYYIEEDLSKSPTYLDVKFSLSKIGYVIDDFLKGTCKLKDSSSDDRIFKIGKILKLHKMDISLSNFINCDERSSSRSNISATLSRNAYDILMMSTSRGWRSCMTADSNNFLYVGNDLAFGTLIIYFHDENDIEIKKPTGRILLKPFIAEVDGKTFVIYKQDKKVYGTVSINTKKIIDEIENYVNSSICKEYSSNFISGFRCVNNYNDGISNTHVFSSIKPEDVLTTDFSNIDDDTVKHYINMLEHKWMVLQNPSLVKYISIDSLMRNNTVANDKLLEDYVLSLSKNTDSDLKIKTILRMARNDYTGQITRKKLLYIIKKLDPEILTLFTPNDILRISLDHKDIIQIFENNKSMTIISMSNLSDENKDYVVDGSFDIKSFLNSKCLNLKIQTDSPLYKEMLNQAMNGDIKSSVYIAFKKEDYLNMPLHIQILCLTTIRTFSLEYVNQIFEKFKELNNINENISLNDFYSQAEKYRIAYKYLNFPDMILPFTINDVVYKI